jgi:predicted GIY-YIG superfamily endonuclease
MPECSDGSLYVGHTDDLDTRLSAHRQRMYAGYTASRLPIRRVFSGAFETRDEAFAAERRLKGWSRAKKLALANGEWELLAKLASIRSPDRRAARSSK